MRVLVLILFCLSIYVPTASAELYQNRDYNFQMNIPDGWENVKGKNQYVLMKRISGKKNNEIFVGGFSLEIFYNKYFPSGTSLQDLTKGQEKDLENALYNVLKETNPNVTITYSDYLLLNKNRFLMLKMVDQKDAFKYTYLLGIMNRTDYFFKFLTNDPTGQYEQQFFDMLKTLRPIVGDSDGDFEEEIMYMHDIAEQEAISQITGESVTIVK